MENKTPEEILDSVYDSDYRSNFKTNYPKQCILKAMKEYGKQQYNQAVLDCIENAKTDCKYKSDEWGMNRSMYHSVDSESMKKPLKQ